VVILCHGTGAGTGTSLTVTGGNIVPASVVKEVEVVCFGDVFCDGDVVCGLQAVRANTLTVKMVNTGNISRKFFFTYGLLPLTHNYYNE
jgi:hypothetical protein